MWVSCHTRILSDLILIMTPWRYAQKSGRRGGGDSREAVVVVVAPLGPYFLEP